MALAGAAAIVASAHAGPAGAQAGGIMAVFRPVPLGEAVEANDMRVHAQLYPAVRIHGLRDESAGQAIIEGKEYAHLACQVRARGGNVYGFRNGEWVPGLRIRFTLTHQGSGTAVEGDLFPMVARDGPHYGINLHMLGEGEYTLVFHIRPPKATVLTRVTGDPAGVAAWWKPFDVKAEFTYRRDDVFFD